MPSSNRFPWYAFAFLAACALIFLSIKYLDRPIAQYAAVHYLDIAGLGRFAAFPGWLLLPALLAPFVFVVWKLPLTSKLAYAAMLTSISVVWTSAVVEIVLKRVLGRASAGMWLWQHTYGFHLFAGTDPQYRSFPSGEAAILSAVICALWPLYPRWRPLFALLAIGETFLILSLNWHFLSDVIAGALVGVMGRFVAKALLRHLSRFGQDPADYGSTN